VRLNFVSELCHIPPETLGQHRHLRGHAHAHRCCGKSLIASALVGFGVRQHARRESISKRAPSTTRTSLRFGINGLRAVCNSVAQKCLFQLAVANAPCISGLRARERARRENGDRPSIVHDHLRRIASDSIALVIDAHEQSTADAFDPPDAFEHVSCERPSGGLVCGERRPNAAESGLRE